MSYRSAILLCYSSPKSRRITCKHNSVNAIAFNLQAILFIMEATEKLESSYYSLSYWKGSQVTHHVVAMDKVAE